LERVSTRQATDTYIRWGRSSCPSGATIVYDGFTAGSHSYHDGAAANHICLSKKPKYHYYSKKPKWSTLIYGAEYGTLNSIWNNLHNHDIPCAVCHVPRSSIIMHPGRNDCPDNFKLEYGGYLMAGHYGHDAATEFVCFDGSSHADKYSSSADHDGSLFYFVEAACGALKCGPYESGKQITCAVCSYSP
jgi:N-acetylated-alpha-linked acidic dipeptidase